MTNDYNNTILIILTIELVHTFLKFKRYNYNKINVQSFNSKQ